jgi:MOSC domain-containing protein YiiM
MVPRESDWYSMTMPSKDTGFEGRVFAIYIGACKAMALHAVDAVEAVPGKGIVGDRYFLQQGTFTKPGSPDREVTLIELEAIEALERECQIKLEPSQARRNLVTRGVPLNHLVGREFHVGDVLLRGLRLCEPCGHLEGLTVKGIKEGLCHRGGLRAQILRGGLVRTGDAIRPHQPKE